MISSFDPPFKKSLRSEQMLPQAVLIDPELTVGNPPHVTQGIPGWTRSRSSSKATSRRSQPVTQALCAEGLQRAWPRTATACHDGDRMACEVMAHAAFLVGKALANSGLGLAHGSRRARSAPQRAAWACCAVMLPITLEANRSVCEAEFAELARAVMSRRAAIEPAAAEAFIDGVCEMAAEVGIPTSLASLGVTAADVPALVKSSHGNSRSGNPRDVSDGELAELLESALA
ncbi:MAG: iron-containing alcohol dehydrogenase [Planctomycetaceae bacterium]